MPFRQLTAGGFNLQNTVGAEVCAVSAMNAYERLVHLLIPEHASYDTCPLTVSTTYAFVQVKANTTSLPRRKCICRAHIRTWRFLTCLAHDHNKPSLHAACRSHEYAGHRKPHFPKCPRTREHAALTAHTSLSVHNQTLDHRTSPSSGALIIHQHPARGDANVRSRQQNLSDFFPLP